VIPVVTPAEMGVIDAEAPEPVEELIDRAGWATARIAARLLAARRGVYGSRVAVVAGKGNNGADGRRAARFLTRRGVQCTVFDVLDSDGSDDATAAAEPARSSSGHHGPHSFDLVIDAAFGTGLRGRFWSSRLPIEVGDTPVLAVDIPSGVNGLTGEVQGRPLQAATTITFAAPKPGLLFEPGRSLAGHIVVADIGLDCTRARLHLLEEADLSSWPTRRSDAHKWRHAVAVIGGGQGMAGAAVLSSTAALRSGAGYVVKVRQAPLVGDSGAGPIEAVSVSLVDEYQRARELIERCSSAVVGPGLGTDDESQQLALAVLAELDVSAVVDAGALQSELVHSMAARAGRQPLHVLTPHDGEFTRITGRPPGGDRVAASRAAAARLDAVIVLKGSTTVIAHPDGRALLSTSGDQRLATAGTGDVLSGVIGAGLALGLDPFLAAGLGVELHGRAACLGRSVGLTAGDLPGLVAKVLAAHVD